MTSIRINLLPHRQMRRARMQRLFAIMAIASAVAGVAVVALGQVWISTQQRVQQARNTFLSEEIAKLDKQIAEIKQLKEKTQDLLDRKEVVEALQADRGESVRLFDTLAREVPEGLHLKSVNQTGNTFTVSGYAQSSARVSTFMRALDASEFFLSPVLVEVKAVQVGSARMNEFSLTVQHEGRQSAEDEPKKPAGEGGKG